MACTVAFSLPAIAGGQGSGKSHNKTNQEIQGQGPGATVVGTLITAAERSIIFGYIQQNRGSPSYGFAGAQPLTPGIANKIARGGSMPPGIAKRYFPTDLMTRLPPRPGQQWLAVGTDILLIDAATQVVLDILHQVL